MSIEENIISYVRIRPVSENEEKILEKSDDKSVIIPRTKESFSFEKVFDEFKSTSDIFEEIGISTINACFEGKNVCIFAYGQTSSGKTHTMKGSKESPGIIPQSISHIFSRMESDTVYLQIKVSFLEIYNETIIDLLSPSSQNIEIREHHSKGIYLQNLSEKIVTTKEEAEQLYQLGETNRKFAETSQNNQSSRSHVIFRLNFELRDTKNPAKILQSVLNLIDLAGSENIGRSKVEKDTKTKNEGVNINKSLLALSSVINKLSMNTVQYINYRDSKLTRLLQPCLGGNSRTVVICAINPSVINYQETRDTLNFGKNAGAIKNIITVNEKSQSVAEKASVNFQKDCMEVFTKENSELKNLVEKSEEIQKEKDTCIQSLKEQIDELSDAKSKHIEKIIQQNEELNDLRAEVFSLKNQNDDLKQSNLQQKNITESFREKDRRNSQAALLESKLLDERNQRIGYLEDNLKQISQTYQLMQEEGMKLTNQNAALLKTVEDLTTEKNQLISNNKTLQQQLTDLKKTALNNVNKPIPTPTQTPPVTQQQTIIQTPIIPIKPFNNEEKENVNTANQKSDQLRVRRIDKTATVGMVDERLENLQRDGFSLSKHLQQNQEIEELHVQLSSVENQLVCAQYKINELQQELMNIQGNSSNITESKQNSQVQQQQRRSFVSDCDSSMGENVHKRFKKDEYGKYYEFQNFIKKKIDTEVDSLTLKREIRTLNKRLKQMEAFALTQRNKIHESNHQFNQSELLIQQHSIEQQKQSHQNGQMSFVCNWKIGFLRMVQQQKTYCLDFIDTPF